MKEIDEIAIKKIINIIYEDALNKKVSTYFITLKYKYIKFKDIMDKDVFESIIPYLPHLKLNTYNSKLFILSVLYNIKTKEFEFVVVNPRLNKY